MKKLHGLDATNVLNIITIIMDNIIEYYKRQTVLDEVGIPGQKCLLKSKVIMIGAGGLGCPALQYLAAAGIGHIHIIDGDTIDRSNLHRQILFNENDIGEKKSQTAAQKISTLSPFSKVTWDSQFISIKNISILKDYDYIVEGSDNFKTKFLIHDYCHREKLNLVSGSIHKFDGTLYHFPFKNNPHWPCLRCLWPVCPPPTCVGNCQEAGVLGVVPGLFGVLMANEVIKGILGIEILQMNSYYFDLKTLEKQKIKIPKRKDCPQCGEGENAMNTTNFQLQFSEIENPNDYLWIDIRTPEERVENFSQNFPYERFKEIPMDTIIGHLEELKDEDKVMIFCAHGVRSFNTVQYLRSQGHEQFFSFQGSPSSFTLK